MGSPPGLPQLEGQLGVVDATGLQVMAEAASCVPGGDHISSFMNTLVAAGAADAVAAGTPPPAGKGAEAGPEATRAMPAAGSPRAAATATGAPPAGEPLPQSPPPPAPTAPAQGPASGAPGGGPGGFTVDMRTSVELMGHATRLILALHEELQKSRAQVTHTSPVHLPARLPACRPVACLRACVS